MLGVSPCPRIAFGDVPRGSLDQLESLLTKAQRLPEANAFETKHHFLAGSLGNRIDDDRKSVDQSGQDRFVAFWAFVRLYRGGNEVITHNFGNQRPVPSSPLKRGNWEQVIAPVPGNKWEQVGTSGNRSYLVSPPFILLRFLSLRMLEFLLDDPMLLDRA